MGLPLPLFLVTGLDDTFLVLLSSLLLLVTVNATEAPSEALKSGASCRAELYRAELLDDEPRDAEPRDAGVDTTGASGVMRGVEM